MTSPGPPVISLLDMDCFYVQVETREEPRLAGRPAAVVQYNSWKGGGIIAVNYEARAKGVSRNMRGAEAREKCPEIELVTVPVVREKANLSKYRKAGREVIEVLLDSGATVERASIDEAYLDLTKLVEARLARGETVTADDLPNTWLGGLPGHGRDVLEDWVGQAEEAGGEDLRLAVGAKIMEEVRAEVFRRTQFRCSAGISHCKTLAKLCCGLNKPNKQTVLPQSQLGSLYRDLKLTKVRGLGGKLGETVVAQLGVETMAELAQLSLQSLGARMEAKTAHWLYMLARGKDGEVVKERELPKSIGCGKNFRGKEKLETRQRVEEKVGNLVEELVERLEEDRDEYSRLATGLTVGVKMEGEGYVSRAGGLSLYTPASILSTVMALLTRLNTARDRQGWSPALLNVTISAGKFVSTGSGQSHSITAFFSSASAEPPAETEEKSTKQSFTPTSATSNNTEDHREENSKPQSFVSTSSTSKKKPKDQRGEKSKPQSLFLASTSLSSVTQNHNPPPAETSSTKPKSFFKMKLLEDLENMKKKSASTKVAKIEDVCNPQKNSSDKDSVVKNPPESLASTSSSSVTQKHYPPPTETSSTKPKSFFKMKLLEDLENMKKKSASTKVAAIEDVCNPQKHSSDEDSVVKKPPEKLKDEEDTVIDVAELIPSLSTFDPSLMDFLPLRLQIKAKERISLLKEKEKTTAKPGTMVSFLKSSGEEEPVDKVEDCVECEVCHKNVSAFTLPEHLDWHYAVSLSKQSNSQAGVNKLKFKSKPREKRKREELSGAGKKENGKKSRTTDISKFFIKS